MDRNTSSGTTNESPTLRASVAMGLALLQSMRQGGGTPLEADHELNEASRAIVSAMTEEHGASPWLGQFNRAARRDGSAPLFQLADGEPLFNFGADFAIPTRDAEVEILLVERESAPYVSTAVDRVRVDAILARVRALGGALLVWT